MINTLIGYLLIILIILLSPFALLVAFIIDIPKIVSEWLHDKNK